jgi:hypothetical protein
MGFRAPTAVESTPIAPVAAIEARWLGRTASGKKELHGGEATPNNDEYSA